MAFVMSGTIKLIWVVGHGLSDGLFDSCDQNFQKIWSAICTLTPSPLLHRQIFDPTPRSTPGYR